MTLREMFRPQSGDHAVWVLIAMNLLPIAGIFILNWTPASVMALYWLETVIIGLWNYPKIWLCKGGAGEKLFISAFFAAHFGMFNFGHMFFLREMYDAGAEFESIFTFGTLFWTGLIFVFSHGVSFFVNYVGRREFEGRGPNEQMFYPYARVVVLHAAIIFAGFLVLMLGDMAGVIVLIAIKTLVDILIHNISHSREKSIMEP